MMRRKNKAENKKSMERKPKTGSAKEVPFERCYEEAGMIEVRKGCFTHGYEIAAPMKPREMTYSAKKVRAGMRKVFALFGDMSFQFVMRNHLIDTAEYLKRIQVQEERYKQGDGADDRTGVQGDGIGRWIGAYNRMLEENADIGHNNYESRVYLTVTTECDYAAEAAEKFGELDGRVADAFKELYGYEARPLAIRERLRLLYEMYHPGNEGGKEIFSEKRKLRNPREMVAPERVLYEKSQILLGKKYVRMFFMNLIPSEIPESLLCDLMAVSGNSVIGVCYSPVDAKLGYEAAERLVDENTKKETVAIRATVADRRARRSEVIKQPKSENEEAYFHTAALSLFDGAVKDGTDVLLTTMVIALICDSNDELERNSVLLRLAAYKYGCQLRICDLMQREALQSVLPLNHVRVNYGRVFPMKRIAAVLPVNVQGLFETRPMFQGLNVINDNFVFADRRSCPVGLITGTAHSGKMFAVKRDAVNTLLMTEDSVFILTKRPEEYRGFMEAVDGREAYFTTDALMENTSGWKKNMSGDSNFWTQSTQALFCCAIGYLFEVAPIEQRNFINVPEILRMDGRDEFCDPDEETDFDKLFQRLGEANPNSYAYQQYITYRKAPNKTALNIMISTTVMLSQYVDMAAFRNLIYKDEMELDRVGQEKVAIFLNIPEGDSTYAWISAMFFSMLFRILMKQGEERMKREGLGDPQLKVPVRCLIDECKNVGRIPNLEGVLSFCRKYRISIVPIFQSFSQLEELYGKGPANEFLSNCDTMMFLGGRDPATLKVICEEMGKRTVKVLSYSNSKGRGSSASVSKQQTGADLMTRVQLSQLSNQECLVFIRGLRPFKDEKYRLEEHPNYRYLAEGSMGKPLVDPFVIAYDDEELERCRLKAVGEDGYVEPKIVDSARRRALIERNRRKVTELERQVDLLWVKLTETIAKKKGTDRIEVGIERNMRLIERLGRILPERGEFGEGVSGSMDEAVNGMAGVHRIKEMKFIGSFALGFEFDEASEEDVKRIFER